MKRLPYILPGATLPIAEDPSHFGRILLYNIRQPKRSNPQERHMWDNHYMKVKHPKSRLRTLCRTYLMKLRQSRTALQCFLTVSKKNPFPNLYPSIYHHNYFINKKELNQATNLFKIEFDNVFKIIFMLYYIKMDIEI